MASVVITDLLAFAITCGLLYGFIRVILTKQKRKGKSRLKHDHSKSIGKVKALVETENGIEFHSVINEEYWKKMAKLTDRTTSK